MLFREKKHYFNSNTKAAVHSKQIELFYTLIPTNVNLTILTYLKGYLKKFVEYLLF